MKRWTACNVLVAALSLAVLAAPAATPARAALPELKVAPLRYDAHLQLGHPKTGFIDASNPTGSTIHVAFQVQAFRQVNDRGELQFYDSPRLSAGIVPAVPAFDLGPRAAVRTKFTIDPNKLGPGGAYGVIFLRTSDPNPSPGEINTSARVGTLLILNVGAGGTTTGRLVDFSAPVFWFSHQDLPLTFAYHNTGAGDQVLAFAPHLQSRLGWTSHGRPLTGPFVFPGRQRQTHTAVPVGSQLGPVPVALSDATGGSPTQVRWVLMVTGLWIWLLPIIILVILGILWFGRRWLTLRKH